MKKSSKRFPISTEAKNSYGFRVKTTGVDLTEFNNNPLLLWMHKRPKGERQDEILPLGYWTDIEVRDGQITGVPMFDESDPFAMKIYNKVENGTIKMASAGLKPGEFEEIDGEKWLIKSSLQEGSLCDIGSNSESLAIALYNDNDEIINLAQFNEQFNINKTQTMKTIQLTEATSTLLKLKDGADAADAHVAILELVTLSKNQETEIATLKSEKKELQDKVDLADKDSAKNKVIALVDKAVEDRKITADQKDSLVTLGEKDETALTTYLGTLKAAPLVTTKLSQGEEKDDSLLKLSWDELDKSNKLITLKEQNPEAFKEKYKDKFGSEPKS